MSRYFNETAKADKWANNVSAKLGLNELFSSTHGGEESTEDVEKNRVESSRQLTLPVPKDIPLLTRTDDSLVQAAESYRTLRTRLTRMQGVQGIRSVVFSSALPGEGKTLTTMNLGLCCAQITSFKVLVVDADFRKRGLTELLGAPPGMGLSELLAGRATYEQAVVRTNLPNLYVVPAGGPTVSPAELFATSKWKEFIGWASETFKLVLIDAPPILPLTDFELISAACDGVIFVIRGGSTSREIIHRASAQVDSRKLLGSVYNMSQDVNRMEYQGYAGSTFPESTSRWKVLNVSSRSEKNITKS
jgi:protein-tyrosine kinase